MNNTTISDTIEASNLRDMLVELLEDHYQTEIAIEVGRDDFALSGDGKTVCRGNGLYHEYGMNRRPFNFEVVAGKHLNEMFVFDPLEVIIELPEDNDE